MSVTAHFFGGPWDGRVQALQDAPYRLVVPVLGEVRYTPHGAEDVVKTTELHYIRRGPELAGHVYYDVDPNSIPITQP